MSLKVMKMPYLIFALIMGKMVIWSQLVLIAHSGFGNEYLALKF